eukprot:SAG31_NODE_250_length_19098_cov_4.337123_5_plen_105_part_00
MNGHDLLTTHNKSLEECKEMCLQNPECRAIEYGTGSSYTFRAGDCRLQSGRRSGEETFRSCFVLNYAESVLDVYEQGVQLTLDIHKTLAIIFTSDDYSTKLAAS